uniref:Uncharacterized protein n=1 Tax=Candidatus Kentrum sp. FW TaxID=2126338 RepID=A0A450TSA8_9GAMM|nr:MAG: hypothetical protein BECKFW1821C_GA0114237_102627 [Candidatus Kentron sp. FW]
MNTQLSYVEKLADLIRKSPPSPLEEVLRARLTGDHSQVHGITSPPPTRDEPNANLLVYYVYNLLKNEQTSREHLRRSIANLTVAALAEPNPDLDYIQALGGLVGYTQVRESSLAESLRFQFLGFLAFGLPVQMEHIMELHGVELARASHILDIFLAITPPLWEGMDQEKRQRFIATFRQARRGLGKDLDSDRFHLFLLLFRAILKLAPESAGTEAFPEMCRVVESVKGSPTRKMSIRIRRAWLGTCREFGILLNNGKHTKWRERFLGGLLAGRRSIGGDSHRPAFREIFHRSLEKIKFDRDEILLPIDPPTKTDLISQTVETPYEHLSPNVEHSPEEIYFHRAATFEKDQALAMPETVREPQETYSAKGLIVPVPIFPQSRASIH